MRKPPTPAEEAIVQHATRQIANALALVTKANEEAEAYLAEQGIHPKEPLKVELYLLRPPGFRPPQPWETKPANGDPR